VKPVKLEIIHQQTDDGSAIVALNGRLMLGPEGAQLEILVKDLLAKGIRKLVFDFTELSHIDSTGIGRCISSLNLIMKSGGKLAIAGASGQVRDGFRVTQLDRVFRFYDDLASAKAGL
jgi:anti-anti-sigma factor